jgi:hypothetical protein
MHRQIMAIAQQAARKLATHIAQPDETDLHVFDILSLRRSPGDSAQPFAIRFRIAKPFATVFRKR